MKKAKKDILFYSILIFSYIVFAIFLGNIYLKGSRQVATSPGTYFPNVIIDPGHGGEDSGASSRDGIMEKDINLSISKKLRDMMVAQGYRVSMTREIDISIHDESANTIRQKKVSDLKNRLNIVNADTSNVLISIHQNNFESSKYSGAQVFYSKNNPLSRDLANSMRLAFVESLQPENKREIKPAGKNIYILHKANVPAVIVECGFLSNDEETKKLIDESYQEKTAKCILDGFTVFYNSFNG